MTRLWARPARLPRGIEWTLLGLMLAGSLLANLRRARADRLRYESLRSSVAPLSAGTPSPRVSILAAAWNEAQLVERFIESVRGLRYANRELVLCAGGDDDTYERCANLGDPDLVLLRQQRGEGKQSALRRCLERASGQVVFLTDADCLLDDTAFEATLGPILCEGATATTSGAYRPLPEQRRHPLAAYKWSIQLYTRAWMGEVATGLLGGNCAVRRDALESSGGFGANVPTGTDYVLAQQLRQAGHRIRAVRQSAVAKSFQTAPGRYVQQQTRWLRNLLLHGWRWRQPEDVVHAVLTGLVGVAGLSLPFAAIFGGRLAWTCWLGLWLHSLISRLRYLLLAQADGLELEPRLVAAIPLCVALDWWIGATVLIESLLPWRRWRW